MKIIFISVLIFVILLLLLFLFKNYSPDSSCFCKHINKLRLSNIHEKCSCCSYALSDIYIFGVRSGLSLLLVTCNSVQPATWTGGWCLNQLPPLAFLLIRKVACHHIVGKTRPVKAWMSLLEPAKTHNTHTHTHMYVCLLRYLSNFHSLYIKCIYVVFCGEGSLFLFLILR